MQRLVWVAAAIAVGILALGSASSASGVKAHSTVLETEIEQSTKDSKPPQSYSPPLSSFVPNNSLSGEATLTDCDAWGNTKEINSPTPCVEGDVSARRTIVLVGDSNVGNWAPALSEGLSKLNYRLDVFSFAGCPTSDIEYMKSDYIGTSTSSCNKWHERVTQVIAKLSPVAILTASSGIGSQYNQSTWDEGYKTLFQKASGNRPTVKRIVVGTSPYFPTPPPVCLSVFPKSPLRCLLSTKTETIVGAYSTYAARDDAVAKASDATLIKTASLFCYHDECPAEVAGTVTFADNDHLTTAYSDDISTALTDAVVAAMKL